MGPEGVIEDAFKRWLFCDDINVSVSQIAKVAYEAVDVAESVAMTAADRLTLVNRQLEVIGQMANRVLVMREGEYEALTRGEGAR